MLRAGVWWVGRDERFEHASIYPEMVQVCGWIDAPHKNELSGFVTSLETEVMDTDATSSRKAVIQRELTWHEQEAHGRYSLDAFLYDPPALDAVVQPAIEYLQGNTGELVLDMGCGEGKETLELASRGLHVISTDLSHTQLSPLANWYAGKSQMAQSTLYKQTLKNCHLQVRAFVLSMVKPSCTTLTLIFHSEKSTGS